MKHNSDTQAPRGRKHDRLTTLAVAATGALIVAALWQFNQSARGYEFYLVGNMVALFFVPMLVIVFLLGQDLSAFGFSIGDSRKVKWLTVALFAGLLILLVPASRLAAFQDYYPIFKGAQFIPFRGGIFSENSLHDLIYGWASYGMYMFFWEFFFRGYLLFGLFRTIKWPAVIIQALAFGLLHWNKVPLEVAASFFAGIILGMLALRAKSFLPCFALHWAAAVTFDALVIVGRN